MKNNISVTDAPMSLRDLRPGDAARVVSLRSSGGMRRRLLDLGLTEDTTVSCLGRSPGGDLTAFMIRGAVIAIRSADCADILVSALPGEARYE